MGPMAIEPEDGTAVEVEPSADTRPTGASMSDATLIDDERQPGALAAAPARPRRRSRTRVLLGVASAVSAVALVTCVALLLSLEYLDAAVVTAAVVALAALLGFSGWWRRPVAVTLAVDLMLVFVYTWSLGETVHVVVRSTANGYVAYVEGNVARLQIPGCRSQRSPWPTVCLSRQAARRLPHGHRIGLYGAGVNRRAVSPLGGASLQDTSSLLARLGTAFRFATPNSAWTNVQITVTKRNGPVTYRPKRLRASYGNWFKNSRGELEGSLAAYGFFAHRRPWQFAFSADLVRPDGVQGVLVGVNRRGRGYLLEVNMDQVIAEWHLSNHQPRARLGSTPTFRVHALPTTQRIVRLAPPSVLPAMALLTAALVVYPLLLALVLALERLIRRVSPRLRQARVGVPGWLLDTPLALIVTAGVAITGWMATNVYPGIPFVQDATAYMFQAKTLALGRIWVGVPKLPSFFTDYFVLALHGHWFGKYPPGWPLLLSIGVLAHAPWLVNPVITGGGLALIYLIGRELYGRKVALLAAVLALASPFVLFIGNAYYPDGATWLFLGSFVFLVLLWRRNHESEPILALDVGAAPLLVPAGVLFGMAFVTRQLDALAFGLPFFVLLLRRPLSLVWLGIGGMPLAVLYGLYNRALTGNLFGNAYTAVSRYDRLGFGRSVGGPPGTYNSNFTFARSLWNMSGQLEHLQSSLFGWPYFFALCFVAIPFVLGRAGWRDWLLAAAATCVVAAYGLYFYYNIIWGDFPRYWYLTVPCLSLLTARGLQELYRWPLRAFPGLLARRRMAALALPTMVLAVLLTFNLVLYVPATVGVVRAQNAHDLDPIRAARRARIHHAVIFQVQGSNFWWPYGAVFAENSPLLNGDIIWARDEGTRDVQLMRLYPHRSFYRLDGSHLTRLFLHRVR